MLIDDHGQVRGAFNMQVFSVVKRFAVVSIIATFLLSACQEGKLSSYQGNARPSVLLTSEVLGDAPNYPALQPYPLSEELEAAWRVPSSNTGGWTVNPSNRQLARAFYNSVYSASLNTPIEWTGNHAACNAGATSSAFKDSVLARINYFRAMAGVPASVTLSNTFNTKAQQAALMMSANNSLSHTPPSSWRCYTADGYTAASSSNISLGHNGWDAVGGQMRDNGTNNTVAGHRRWLLYPQTQQMGTGDVPAIDTYSAANAVWVFDGRFGSARPTTRDDFVAWPTKGFNPYQVVPVRWSFAYPGANFANATVSMKQGSVNVPVTLETPTNGYGENTLVWRPNNMTPDQDWPKPAADTSYQVSVNNVTVNGSSRNFSYTVTVIDPQSVGTSEEQVQVSGNTNPVGGALATYTFNAVSLAQQYEAYVAEISEATGSYNAESDSLNVTDGTDASYDLIYSDSDISDTAVYRLAPVTSSETVEFPITYIPSGDSILQFDSKLGYATDGQTAALQISVDGGASWRDIYSKTGTSSGNEEESAFSTKTLSLSAYADKLVKFRAQYRHNGYRYVGVTSDVSFLVDNVQISNAQQVVAESIQNTGSATSFSFTPANGKRYALAGRAIPWVGYPGLDWGAVLYSDAANGVDTQPDAFSFTAQTNVARSSLMTSNEVTVSGIEVAVAMSVAGGHYSINGAAFTNTPRLVSNGDRVRVQHTSATGYATKVDTTLTIGGVDGTFSSTTLTEPVDTTPDAFSFTAQTNVVRSSAMTSNSITVGGVNAPAAISVAGGSYSINGGAFTSTAGTVSNGATVRVQHNASANYATKVDTTLTIGGVSSMFSSTTLAEPIPMIFNEKTDVLPSTLMTSNSITVNGLTAPVALTITGGEYSKNSGVYSKAKGTVQNGDQLVVRHTSSSKSKTAVTTTVKLGAQTLTFKSTTLVIDTAPDAFSFAELTNVLPATVLESELVTLTGMNAPTAVSISAGEYSLNGGAYTKAKGTAKTGDTLRVRHVSSSKSQGKVTTALTVGGVKASFVSTVMLLDTVPDAFSFPAKTAVALNTVVESDPATIAGINVPTAVSVSGGEYSLNGGAYTKVKGALKAGDILRVRHLSSKVAKKTVTTTVMVGTIKAVFKSTAQ